MLDPFFSANFKFKLSILILREKKKTVNFPFNVFKIETTTRDLK